MDKETQLAYICRQFDFGTVKKCEPYGSGHINDTYLVIGESEGETNQFILQCMNRHIFRNMDQLMENVVNVTEYIKKQIGQKGGDPLRETLNVIGTREGKNFYLDEKGNGWRAYYFVRDTFSLDAVRSPEDFYESAVAFGNFQRMLADYPAETLHETIPDFHNTKARFERFLQVVEADPLGRVREVLPEIQFIRERKELAASLVTMQEQGVLPVRVTHNDTKLNNILMDKETGKGLCIIDLDTVMPGLSAYDFGDAIRFGASTAAEDETDLDKVQCDTELFAVYARGYIEGCKGTLTEEEIKVLPLGAKVITFENGIRFLVDYLEGDVYFKIHRPGQNLDRARTQLKLVADMEKKWKQMQEIVENIKKI